jgi:hypothetical protein
MNISFYEQEDKFRREDGGERIEDPPSTLSPLSSILKLL